jgi:7-cyano-7-deazaguanine reductase
MSDDSNSDSLGRRKSSEEGHGVADVPVLQRTPVETDGLITTDTSDVTAWCPYEGTTDYYTLHLEYWPEKYALELMSYRDYLQTFRDEEIGHEEFAQKVYDDLVALLETEWLRLNVEAPPRYGLNVILRHQTDPKPLPHLDSEATEQRSTSNQQK